MVHFWAVLLLVAWAQNPPAQDAGGATEAYHFDVLGYKDRLEADGSQVRTMEVQVRLGTPRGVAQFGEIGLPFLDGNGDVQFEEVSIEKPSGRRVEVRNGLVQDVNPFGVSGTSLPADVRFRKLTIPGLEPGDKLSYRIVNRQKPLSTGHTFGEFRFAGGWSGGVQTYELDLPRGSALKVRLRPGLGADWEEVPSSPDRHVRRLTLGAEPPSGAARLSKSELQARIEPDVSFTSFTSWADVARWWWDLARDRLKPDPSVAEQAASLIKGASSPREKAVALHSFLAARIRYVNVSFGLGRMQPRRAAEVLSNRYGDCKDKHALLAALAASVGLDARPVLVNSVRSDLADDVPGPQQFDHMISVVRLGPSPSDWLWLDGTNPFGGPGYLLPQLRDKRALLVEANGDGVLVRTPAEPPFKPRQEVTLKGHVTPDGVLRGRVTWAVRADAEGALRFAFSALPRESLTSAVRQGMAGDWEGASVENVVVSDPLDFSSPFRVEFDVEAKVPARRSEGSLRLPPLDFELPEPESPPPKGEPAVVFAMREISARAEIEIPEGDGARAPLSVSLDRPFGAFRSAYSVDGRTLKIERTLTLSKPSLTEAELAGYVSFREAIAADRKQEFSITFASASPQDGDHGGFRSDGLAAMKKKDYAKAADLLRKATEADPQSKVVFEDLGRALVELGRNEEAAAAFTRQIENAPYHESAYSWRAFALEKLNRGADAEKDLLKQIEVAPFKPWSYQKLAERRAFQERYAEAADFYARAAAIEPKNAERWLDLGATQAKADRTAEARASLDRATSLDLEDWMKVRAATAYQSLGDVAKAGEVARAALPSLSERLVRIAASDLDPDDQYWYDRLVDAWRFVGEAARAAGDVSHAEAYLGAAWRNGFSPQAGWALGDLREGQARLADAVELWSMAASVPTAAVVLPKDRQARIDAACKKLPAVGPPPGAVPPGIPAALMAKNTRPSRQAQAEGRLMELRTIRLSGPVLADLTTEVLLLADAQGKVERIVDLSRKKPEAFDRQIARFGVVHLPSTRPDDVPYKSVRRGLLVCTGVSGCAIILDIPGVESSSDQAETRSIRVLALDPKDGTTLRRGQEVTVTATVHYEIHSDDGYVGLVVQDQARKSLTATRIVETVAKGSGEVTLSGTFTVPADATGIDVFLPLFGPSRGATTAVGGARYPVR